MLYSLNVQGVARTTIGHDNSLKCTPYVLYPVLKNNWDTMRALIGP